MSTNWQTVQDQRREIRFKQEALLEEDAFHLPAYREGLESLAQTIQNLILIEQGTYPNQPQLGVGIEKYMFEIIDEGTTTEIENEIKNQVNEFILHPSINIDVHVSILETELTGKANTISVKIDLMNDITESTDSLQYLIAASKTTKKIVSKAYFYK